MVCTVMPAFLVLGCSPAKSPEPPAPAPAAKTVFDPLVQDLKKAQGVQQTVDAGTEKARSAVDQQERGDATP